MPAGGLLTEPTGSQRLVLSVSLLKSSSKSLSMYWHWFECAAISCAVGASAQLMGSPLRLPARVAAKALPTATRGYEGVADVLVMLAVSVTATAPGGGAGVGTGAGPLTGALSGSAAGMGVGVAVAGVGDGLVADAPHAPPTVSTW